VYLSLLASHDFERSHGRNVASSLAQETAAQDESEKDVACLSSKSPGHETLRVHGPTESCTKTSPITIGSAADASSDDGGPKHTLDEPNTTEVSAFEERINHLVAHLTNEEDRAKLKTFMLEHPRLTSDGSSEYYW